MDFAQIEPDHTHFGKSLRESIADRSLRVREYTCCEGGRLASERHCDESHSWDERGVRPNVVYWPRQNAQEDDVAHTKATMLRTARYKYVRRLYEKDQLFDMQSDPGEQHNLIEDELMHEVLTDMRLKMLEWYQETCDVVPFRYDERHSFKMIWSMVKSECPPAKEKAVKELISKERHKLHLNLLLDKVFAIINEDSATCEVQ